jgi:DNA-binding beta-propeller fold protein YncE
MSTKRLGLLAALLIALAGASIADDKAASLTKVKEITLEGGGYFDYVAFDGGRIYVAHETKIEVYDAEKYEKVGEVPGVDGAHGAAIAAEAKRGFATAGKKSKAIVFDLETLKVTKEIETGQGCDGILHVASAKEIWTFNGKGQSVTVIDPSSLEVKATIKLAGKPEAAVEHAEKGVVYVNLEDKSEISVIDIKKHEVTGSHSVAPGEEPSGLAFDEKAGLLFAGCGNKKLAVVDVNDWKVVATPEIGEHCDGCAYDPETKIVYASCRGNSSAIHMKDAKTFEALPGLDAGKTCTLDPKTHKLFITSGPKRGEKGAVKVLVYAPAK